ncbi:hypothetical protein Tco_0199905 [Tanacetum coccineum]
MMKAAAGWYEPPAFATSHLVAATVAASHCRTLTKVAATVAAANCCTRMCGTNLKRTMHGSYHACHVLLQNESYMHDKYGATRMTYGGPSLSNDGEKRKDSGRRLNLVATVEY